MIIDFIKNNNALLTYIVGYGIIINSVCGFLVCTLYIFVANFLNNFSKNSVELKKFGKNNGKIKNLDILWLILLNFIFNQIFGFMLHFKVFNGSMYNNLHCTSISFVKKQFKIDKLVECFFLVSYTNLFLLSFYLDFLICLLGKN